MDDCNWQINRWMLDFQTLAVNKDNERGWIFGSRMYFFTFLLIIFVEMSWFEVFSFPKLVSAFHTEFYYFKEIECKNADVLYNKEVTVFDLYRELRKIASYDIFRTRQKIVQRIYFEKYIWLMPYVICYVNVGRCIKIEIMWLRSP